MYSLVILPDGFIASGSYDSSIRIWDVNLSKTIKILNGHTGGK